jgi:hypothetical protein
MRRLPCRWSVRGGGSALSVSVVHTVLDAKSLMMVLELWAKEVRHPQPLGPLPSPNLPEDYRILEPKLLDEFGMLRTAVSLIPEVAGH